MGTTDEERPDAMKIGDVYRNDPKVFTGEKLRKDLAEHGPGPFVITGGDEYGVYCKSLSDGRSFGPWSNPCFWGIFDAFLTAAYKANAQKES
jgi:hypothetical protein